MKKTKILLNIFVLGVIFLSACSKTNNSHNFLKTICLDLSLVCSEIKSDNMDRYSLEGINNHSSFSTNISGGLYLYQNIQSYFESNSWEYDLYNMADGMEGSLVGYQKNNIYCQIVGFWDLDDKLDFTGSGSILINCFDNIK